MLTGTSALRKVVFQAHFKLRQSSEMVQTPEVAVDKVWVLRLLSDSHIWDRVTLGGQVGGSSGGVGEGDGDGKGDGEGDERDVEVGRVGLEEGQLSAQCM